MRVAGVSGMEVSLLFVLAVFVVLQGITISLTLFLASRGTGLVLDLFQELDEKLAQAIQKVIETGGMPGLEAVNPLQQAIAQLLVSKINENTPDRNPTGQFIANVDNE